MQAVLPPLAPPSSSNGARLVTADGRALPFREATVHVRAQGGVAVVALTQRFANPYAEPLSVRYTMPLPADAAVRGYSFLLGQRLVRGQVDKKRAARERFERAVAQGHTAGLLEQERSSVFTQELGNLPPGEELVAIIELDQRLVWLDEGQWEWRFPTVVAPRYMGAPGRVADAAAVSVAVADAPLSPRIEMSMQILDAVVDGVPTSATHALSIERGREGTDVRMAEGARLDRDIAVRWPVAQPTVGLALQAARPEAGLPHAQNGYGLLTVVPPSPKNRPRAVPRDLILLVDASGSMYGAPLNQAKHLMRALVGSLEDADRLEMISFGDRPHRWKRGTVLATASGKRDALDWIDRLQAEGGTEMRSGILEALTPLRDDAQRQVVLITDGLIGFENEIVATLHDRLPRSCRLHTIGVGGSVNRSLTGPAARAGRGVEVVLDLDADPAEATRRLLARTCAPLVTDLVVDGSALVDHAPAHLPDLFSGAPALIGLRLSPAGGSVRLRGRTADGPWSAEIPAPALEPGQGPPSIPTLYGRERVEDLEALWAKGRDQDTIDAQIERTGVDFQIATRLTSWVAVSETRTVDPSTPRRTAEVPQELPHGMDARSLGLRPAAPAAHAPTTQNESAALFSLKEMMSLDSLADDEEDAPARVMPEARGSESEGKRVAAGSAPSTKAKKIDLKSRLSRADAGGGAPPQPSKPAGAIPPPSLAPSDMPALAGGALPPPAMGAPAPSVDPNEPFAAVRPAQAHHAVTSPELRALRKSRSPLWLFLLLLVLASLAAWWMLHR